MNLLLEIIVMVVSESTDESSQELGEIRRTTLQLVSQLAQVPSSAIHFKDVLLAISRLILSDRFSLRQF